MRLTSEARGEEFNVRLFIGSDTLEVAVDGTVEAGVGKVLLAVLRETLTVEGVLEVLQSQSILKDIGWTVCVLANCIDVKTPS